MAKQTASFIDLHVEKLVLGVCALACVGVAAYYFSGAPYTVEGKDPASLCAEAKETADRTAQTARVAKYDPAKPNPGQTAAAGGALDELARWFGASAEGLIKIAGVTYPAPRTQDFSPTVVPVVGKAEEERHGLVKLVPPGVPIVTTGRSSMDIPIKGDLRQMARSGRMPDKTEPVAGKSWVSIGAQIDLAEQLRNFVEARYPQGQAMNLSIVQVHVQRKVVGDANRDWEDVDNYVVYRPFARPDVQFRDGQVVLATDPALREFQDTVRRAQEFIARPALPERTPDATGDEPFAAPVPYYPDPPPGKQDTEQLASQRVRGWLAQADKALQGKRPFSEADPDAAVMLAGAAFGTKASKTADVSKARTLYQTAAAAAKKKGHTAPTTPQEPELLMPIVAHDLDVTEGQKYVYRMRYEILNNFAGDPVELKEVADAQKVTLLSDWSPPSREVEVKSNVYYFLTKDNAKDNEVTFTVFRLVSGDWLKQSAKVKVGERIGEKEKGGNNKGTDFSTGMVCVDIDFNAPRGDVAVVLMNAADGSLWEKSKLHDLNDPRLPILEKSNKTRKRG